MFDCVYPCTCSYFSDPVKSCTYSNQVVMKRQKLISGSLLDRIDTHVEEPRVKYEKLLADRQGGIERKRESIGGSGTGKADAAIYRSGRRCQPGWDY